MGVDDDLAGATSMLLGDLEIGVDFAVASPNPAATSLLAVGSTPIAGTPTSRSSTT